jgi:Immunity protein 7
MYSAHGWATISPSYKNDDTVDDLLDDDKLEVLRTQIADHIQRLGLDRTEARMCPNPFAEIRALNYETHLWLSGCNNHAQWHEAIVDLFSYVATVAPGSYGLLYIENDEDPEHPNHFRVWVLARGALVERGDPFLSPHFPVVEDPASGS